MSLLSSWKEFFAKPTPDAPVVETYHDRLVREVLAQPIPQLTGEEWMARFKAALDVYLKTPSLESLPEDHPALKALNTVRIQAEEAGYLIYASMGDTATDSTDSGPVEFTISFDYADPKQRDFS